MPGGNESGDDAQGTGPGSGGAHGNEPADADRTVKAMAAAVRTP